MGLDLSTKIGKIKLKNPVLVASGTFGHAQEFDKFFDLRKLGAIVTKTITLKPRLGNPPPRIVETSSGMLNAIGLQNPGVEAFIEEKMPFFRKLGIPVIVSVMAYSVGEFVELVKILESQKGIDGFEMNLSCPNVAYGTRAVAGPAAARAQKSHDATMRFFGAHAPRHPSLNLKEGFVVCLIVFQKLKMRGGWREELDAAACFAMRHAPCAMRSVKRHFNCPSHFLFAKRNLWRIFFLRL